MFSKNHFKSFCYDSQQDGTHVLITGVVHGTEPCGKAAIDRIMDDLNTGHLSLSAGKVTFIPVCNERALDLKQRYVHRDLNRDVRLKDAPEDHEDFIANALQDYFEQADVLVDVHSCIAGGDPFVFISANNPQELSYAEDLGFSHAVYDFPQAFINAYGQNALPYSMTMYARTQNVRAAFTLECGQNDDPASADVAYDAIVKALQKWNGLTSPAASATKQTSEPSKPQKIIQLQKVFRKEHDGELAKDFANFEPVTKGQLIAVYNNKTEIRAPEDGYIVLPDPTTPLQKSWFYFGKEISKENYLKQPKI